MRGWVTGQSPEGLPPALGFFFLSENILSRFHSQLCHTFLLAV